MIEITNEIAEDIILRSSIRIKSCNERRCKDAFKGDVPMSPL